MGRPRKRRRETEEHTVETGAGVPDGVGMNWQDLLQDSTRDPTFSSTLDAFPLDDFLFDLSAPEPLSDVDSRALDTGVLDQNHFGDLEGFPVHIQSPTSLINTDNIPNPLPSTQPPFQASQPLSHREAIQSNPSCTCLSNLYSALSSFQSLPPPSFPLTLGTLEKATTLSRDIVRCEECPKKHVWAVQNLMLLSTLFALIANEYSRLLAHIDERVAREETITLRMGERFSPETLHLHTGTSDCPMGFNLDLSGAEWGKITRKAIKQAVVGSDHSPRESLTGLIEKLEQRQIAWHTKTGQAEQYEQCKDRVQQERSDTVGPFMCLQIINNIRRSLRALNL